MSCQSDDVYLPTWAWRLHKENRLKELMDPRLRVSTSEEMEVLRVLETAVICVDQSPERWPTMFPVVAMLAEDADFDAAPVATDPSFSWSDYQVRHDYRAESPLLRPSSSSRGTNASVELSSLNASVSSSRTMLFRGGKSALDINCTDSG